MSHRAQRDYIRSIRSKYPNYFKGGSKVLDIGSLDVNGSCRMFFSDVHYIGCDIGKGEGVDIVSPAHKLTFRKGYFDCIISCEAFEHDQYLPSTLINIDRMLKSGGLFVFTCATTGREIHGTTQSLPSKSPYTNNYYNNVTEEMIRSCLEIDSVFSKYEFNVLGSDLRFYGIKK